MREFERWRESRETFLLWLSMLSKKSSRFKLLSSNGLLFRNFRTYDKRASREKTLVTWSELRRKLFPIERTKIMCKFYILVRICYLVLTSSLFVFWNRIFLLSYLTSTTWKRSYREFPTRRLYRCHKDKVRISQSFAASVVYRAFFETGFNVKCLI